MNFKVKMLKNRYYVYIYIQTVVILYMYIVGDILYRIKLKELYILSFWS